MPPVVRSWTFVVVVFLVLLSVVVLVRHQNKSDVSSVALERVRPNPPAGYVLPAARSLRAHTNVGNAVAHPLVWISPSATNYSGGVAALRSLPIELTVEHVDRLRDALAVPYTPAMGFSLVEYNGIRNDAADLLLRQPQFPPDLLFDFSEMFSDSTQDAVWRDYCLQMLATGWKNLASRNDPDSEAARALAVSVLGEAAGAQSRWAGTALLGLQAMMTTDAPSVDENEFAEQVFHVVSNAAASEQNRITAVRLAGMHGIYDACPAVRKIAQTGETETLRGAAIATLGEIGDEQDHDFLLEIASGSDRFLKKIAEKAIVALKESKR